MEDTKKTYARRWRGFTQKEVSERMAMIAAKRFKNKEDAIAHAHVMVAARVRKIKIV